MHPHPLTPAAIIVIPTLNEADHIRATLLDLLSDTHGWPILVCDGGSTDGTQSVVQDVARVHASVQLIDNPGRTQAHAVNLAAKTGSDMGIRVLIRADAHARYPAGFATGLVHTLDHEQADSVVVPLLAIGAAAPWQAAATALQSSWLGHGGASHRQKQGSGWTDHGHHAAFRLSAFLAIDGYDTRFRANEDAEFDARLRAAGGRIYLQSRWPVGYLPRNGPRAIWRQYLRNGRWRGETILQHGQMRLRQLLPCGVTVMVGITPALVLVDPIGALPALGYLAGVLGASIRVGGRHWARVGCLAVLSHLGFGTGLLVTLLRAAFRPRMGTAHP